MKRQEAEKLFVKQNKSLLSCEEREKQEAQKLQDFQNLIQVCDATIKQCVPRTKNLQNFYLSIECENQFRSDFQSFRLDDNCFLVNHVGNFTNLLRDKKYRLWIRNYFYRQGWYVDLYSKRMTIVYPKFKLLFYFDMMVCFLIFWWSNFCDQQKRRFAK